MYIDHRKLHSFGPSYNLEIENYMDKYLVY